MKTLNHESNLNFNSGFEISLIHINSEFDIRNGALNSSVIAECIVHNYDGFIETIFFQIGDREFPLKALNQNGTYSAVLEKVPISYYDKKWLSCQKFEILGERAQ